MPARLSRTPLLNVVTSFEGPQHSQISVHLMGKRSFLFGLVTGGRGAASVDWMGKETFDILGDTYVEGSARRRGGSKF